VAFQQIATTLWNCLPGPSIKKFNNFYNPEQYRLHLQGKKNQEHSAYLDKRGKLFEA
jgi:hypothetical protein